MKGDFLVKIALLTVMGAMGLCIVGNAAVRNEAALDDGLVAYYKFEGNADDSSGNDNHGTVFNATFVMGVAGEGLEFTGSDFSYVEVPHSPELSPSEAVTIAAWAKVYNYPTPYSSLVYKAGEPPVAGTYRDRVYTLWVTDVKGAHLASTPEGASSQVTCSSPGSLYELNTFVHFAGVIDTAAQTMTIYINGSKVQECPFVALRIRGGDYPLRIGGFFRSHSNQSGLSGVMDEVRIYDRALSDAEIKELFNLHTCDINEDGTFGWRDIVRFFIGCRRDTATWDCDRNGDGRLGIGDVLRFIHQCVGD